ncbi:hypothetical protein L208DRAFT_1383659 [Tricholoma matsutake]|nr:hypothetical protein L208DRAFT_1383659 [Tricholoma matsutake 945]
MDRSGHNQASDGRKKHTTPGGKNCGPPPPSLIISPNLDALLEYEERIRRLTSQLRAGSPKRDSPQSSPHILNTPTGLPPPPRKRRKPQSPTAPQTCTLTDDLPLDVVTTSLSASPMLAAPLTSNPYINSPPCFDQILESQLAPIDEAKKGMLAMETATGSSRDDPADGRKRRRSHQRSRSSGDEKRPKSKPSNNSQPSSPTNSSSKHRVDRFFSIKNTFGLFSDNPSQKPELNDVSNAPLASRSRHSSQPPPKLGDRSRIKVKLFKLKDTSMSPVLCRWSVWTVMLPGDADSNMPKVNEETVLDIRQQVSEIPWTSPDAMESSDLSDIIFRRRRPLLSHDPWLPSSSRSSLDSFTSDTTNGPASTIDPRISISSTIYPPSSSDSHPRSMYQSADHHTTRFPTSPLRRSTDVYPIRTRDAYGPAIHTLDPFQSKSQPATRSSSPKPPVPTTPKPVFDRSSIKTSPRLRQHDPHIPLPSTTNFLDIDKRLELVRKNQKLARVFGQSPGPDVTISSVTRHLRGSLSMSNNLDIVYSTLSTWQTSAGNSRRHSTPTSPDDLSFFHNPGNSPIMTTVDHIPKSNDLEQHAPASASRTSFIDLSDDPDSPPSAKAARSLSPTQSLFEHMTPEEQAEEERRRKRQKLAKLHRFLGSRVPTGLVLGMDVSEISLPPEVTVSGLQENEELPRKLWARRRRSSSAAVFPSTWPDDLDRLKEDLNDEEKAINVRRAHKMEKVFGVAPPQTLYHTRRSPSPSVGPAVITSNKGWTSYAAPGENYAPVYGQRNPNRTSYMKPKPKTNGRPGTSESHKQLLPKGWNSTDLDDLPTRSTARRPSVVYTHYHHSLNSLSDIIDRDDKESLAELHEYLSNGDMILSPISPHLQDFQIIADRRRSSVSSVKSERRRSLPTNTSVVSILSDYNIATPRPEVTDFQARRRRAAKLTQFFGVDYRELISDVLESIENGLEHERKRGTLNPDEVEDLLVRLRKLRTKREGLS